MEIKRAVYGVFSRNLSDEQIKAIEAELGESVPRTFGVEFRKLKEEYGGDVMLSDIISKLKLRSSDVQQCWQDMLSAGTTSSWLLKNADIVNGDIDEFKQSIKGIVAKHLPFSNMLVRVLDPDRLHRLERMCDTECMPKPKKRSKKRGASDINTIADGLRNDLERMKTIQEMLIRPEKQFQELRESYAMLPIVATCGVAIDPDESNDIVEEAASPADSVEYHDAAKHKHKKKKSKHKKHSHSKNKKKSMVVA